MTIGPVQLLVVGFDEPNFQGQIRAELKRLRESDLVRLIDALVVHKDSDGHVTSEQLTDLSTDEAEQLGAYVGALVGIGIGSEEAVEEAAALGAVGGGDGHLLDEDALDVLSEIPPGSAAAIALLEHRWAVPLREAIISAGGLPIVDTWVHPLDLVAVGLSARAEAEAPPAVT
jgi:uncharacterized membrane protein